MLKRNDAQLVANALRDCGMVQPAVRIEKRLAAYKSMDECKTCGGDTVIFGSIDGEPESCPDCVSTGGRASAAEQPGVATPKQATSTSACSAASRAEDAVAGSPPAPSTTCAGCGNELDPECCYCGSRIYEHDAMHDGHTPVPIGCTCGYATDNGVPDHQDNLVPSSPSTDLDEDALIAALESALKERTTTCQIVERHMQENRQRAEAAERKYEACKQQAQIWAQEARTYRSACDSIGWNISTDARPPALEAAERERDELGKALAKVTDELVEAERELDGARAAVRSWAEWAATSRCIYCDERFEHGTPSDQDAVDQIKKAHIFVCAKHPLREVERERDKARTQRDYEDRARKEVERKYQEFFANAADTFREHAEMKAELARLQPKPLTDEEVERLAGIEWEAYRSLYAANSSSRPVAWRELHIDARCRAEQALRAVLAAAGRYEAPKVRVSREQVRLVLSRSLFTHDDTCQRAREEMYVLLRDAGVEVTE